MLVRRRAKSEWLQWGRDQLIAETSIFNQLLDYPWTLQWGRDQLIAETRSSAPSARARTRLQWGRDQLIAETSLSWRPLPGQEPLQWGRDQLIAETYLILSAMLALVAASMGPRSIDRGNAPEETWYVNLLRGFNGAAIN